MENNDENIVTVYGVNQTVGDLIVGHLTQYALTQAVLGLKSIIVKVSSLGTEIEYAIENHKLTMAKNRQNAISSYKIQIREDLALSFSRAIDRAENNPYLREEIRLALMKELEKDLYDMWKQVDSDFQKRIG